MVSDKQPEYHIPVMLSECIDGLLLKPGGVYVDMTFGGGGHTRAMLAAEKGIEVFGFDQDDDAAANADLMPQASFTLINANFRYCKRYLKMHGVTEVDGILADLGISSHQIDAPERGFSTRFDGDLDMRMDQTQSISAETIVNEYDESELHKILGQYGEIRNAKTVAKAILSARAAKPIKTNFEFKKAIERLAPRGKENKFFAQVFQAIRIEVNEEIKALEDMLEQSEQLLSPGGRLVVMSYHSLEDRLVKNFINKGKLYGEVEKDFYGNPLKPLNSISRKPITASIEEIGKNSRARSAKLRIAEKI